MHVIGSAYQNNPDSPKKFGLIWLSLDGFRFCVSQAYPSGLKDFKTLDSLAKEHNLVGVIIDKV